MVLVVKDGDMCVYMCVLYITNSFIGDIAKWIGDITY